LSRAIDSPVVREPNAGVRPATRWIALILGLPLTGCFEFDVPLTPPTIKVDTRLLGEWRCVGFESASSDADKVVHLQFKAMDEMQYEITSPDMCNKDDDAECPSVFHAYASSVANTTFLNTKIVRKNGTLEPEWTFARARLHDPNVLHLDLVDDEAFKGVPRTSEALRKALAKRMKVAGTFSEYCVCARVGSKAEKAL
jgi:hypothetical protein